MRSSGFPTIAVLFLLPLSVVAQTRGRLVDIIPKSLSNETNQESEPSLTINPLDPSQIAISVFTPRIDYCGLNFGPVFYSADGGQSWNLTCRLPTAVWTADATLRFSHSGQLYAGILRRPDIGFIVLRGSLPSDSSLSPILTRIPSDEKHIIDQPYLETTSNSPDEVLVGENDIRVQNPSGAPTASLDESYNSGDRAPTFELGKIDKRKSWFDLPPIRPAAHRDGTIYVAFMAIHGYDETSKQMIGDVVVVRGQRDATTHKLALAGLTDPVDHAIGNRVVKDVRFPYDPDDVPCCLGQQRYQASLSIAVDPTDSRKVYLAWADLTQGVYSLHVRSSGDSGSTWSAGDIWLKPSATNPALAVDDGGVLGFLFQQLTVEKTGPKWVTALERAGAASLILSEAPAFEPTRDFHPYVGDYLELHAVGKTFYGVFSANNTPDRSHFPALEPTFLRNHDWKSHTLLGVDGRTSVPVSIDPFFFEVEDSDAKHPTTN
jgi:hypothetical protein